MSKGLLDSDTLLRVKGQALLHQVDGERLRLGVHLGELLLLLEGQSAQIVPRAMRVDLVEVVQRGCTKDIQDQRELVVV